MVKNRPSPENPIDRSIERQAQWLRWLLIWLFSLITGGSVGTMLSLMLLKRGESSMFGWITRDQLVPSATGLTLIIAAILTCCLLHSPDATANDSQRSAYGPLSVTIASGVVGLILLLVTVP